MTAIFYLNQHWKPSHGGQLRLYPFPAPPVDIDPLQDRLVLFATTRMLHRCDWHSLQRACCNDGKTSRNSPAHAVIADTSYSSACPDQRGPNCTALCFNILSPYPSFLPQGAAEPRPPQLLHHLAL